MVGKLCIVFQTAVTNPLYYDPYEDYNSHVTDEDLATSVTREEFMMVLAKLDRMLVRATYHLYQTSSMYVVCGGEGGNCV